MNIGLTIQQSIAFLLGLALLGTPPASGETNDLVLAENGTNNVQIVVPDGTGDPAIDQSLHQTARLVQQAFRANGAEVRIVTEGARDVAQPGIYLGATAFARANGCDPATLEGWDYFQKAVDGNVIIAGRDEAPPDLSALGDWGRFFYYRLGTLKATTDFLREYAKTFFLYPGNSSIPASGAKSVSDWDLDGATIEYAPAESIRIPADLDLHKHVFTRYHKRHHRTALLYDIANNFFPRVDDALLGHTYGSAIPPAQYRESNPEYFALLGGERTTQGQYCLSNPEVRELIYQFTASFLKAGCQSVNILQPDGFRPCQCENCNALYGTGNDWGEKLWIFHREVAERLKKECPGKKLMISPYTVTLEPPKSFDKFPDNVIISHVDANFEETDKWRQWRKLHTGEYGIWLHDWIANQTSRYTPQRTPLFVEKQVKFFQDYDVRGVYRDGIGEVYGLEGPTYYIFGRMFDDPVNNDAKTLMFEFCDAAFGDAGEGMRRFYDSLYDSIELYALYLNTHAVGWTYTDIYGRRHKSVRDPFRMLSFLYEPSRLATLETYLSQAEGQARGERHIARLRLVRREFDYLKALMKVIHLYHAYAIEPSLASRDRLLDAIDDRNAFIREHLFTEKKTGSGKYDRPKPIEGWANTILFPPGGHNIAHLQLVHNTYGNAFADTCLNWDTAPMRNAPLPGTERLTAFAAPAPVSIDAPEWKEAPAATLRSVVPGAKLAQSTTVRVLYGDTQVYLRITARLPKGGGAFEDLGRDADLTQAEAVDIYLAPDPARDVFYRFTVGPNSGATFDAACGLITDQMNLRYNRDDSDWNGAWAYESQVDSRKGTWTALLSIPYSTVGAQRPAAGATWRANFGRSHVRESGSVERSIWSTLGSTRDVSDRNALGELVFQPDAQASRDDAANESPATRARKKAYETTFMIPANWKNLPDPLPNGLGPWLFRLDPIEKGLEENWQSPDADTSTWEPIPVPSFWNEFKWGRYEGLAWYRTTANLPADWKGHSLRLSFGSVDEEAWVYVNGTLVGEHSRESTGQSVNRLWDQPFEIDVAPDGLKFGEDNVLVVRVNNTKAGGGIWRPVLAHRLAE